MLLTKTISITLTLCVIAILSISCEQNSTNQISTTDIQISNPASFADTIPVDTFNRWVNSWREKGQAFTSETLIEYFTLDKVDLSNVLAENIDSARFYLGLDTLTSVFTPHLMVVGVDNRGKNMIDYSNGKYIYDVSQPCPPLCGGNN